MPVGQAHAVAPDAIQVLHHHGVAGEEHEVVAGIAQQLARESAADPTGADDRRDHVVTRFRGWLVSGSPASTRSATQLM